MQTLLQINSSIYTDDGQSTRLANRLVARWQAATPGGRIILRDLAKEPVPHLDVARFSALTSSPEARTPEQAAVVRYSDELIATRGGRHAGTPGDSQTPFMQTVLGFIGIDDVRFVYAEGLAMGDDSRREALARAEAEIDSLPVAMRAAA